ncbi:hypothetical protein GCM10027043_53040 [Ferruginibacter profundus]
MRYILIIIFFLTVGQVFSQTNNQIGDLNLVNAKVVKRDTAIVDVCGFSVKVAKLTIKAKTEVQTFCVWGNPSLNTYDTIDNKLYLYYSVDTSKIIYQFVRNDIAKYAAEQEIWARQYNTSNDFSVSVYNKSFIVSDTTYIPFIWTGSENPGDYQIYYVNDQVYKFVLPERKKGFGSLLSFANQNIYFKCGDMKLNLDRYLKNVEQVKQILATR